MKCVLRAGALALLLCGGMASGMKAADASEIAAAQPHIDIARIKTVLNLTPQQQAYWPPVEAALRDLSRGQRSSQGFFHRIKERVTSVVLDAQAIARIGAAARPLVRVLDDRQKQNAISLCHEMGLGPVLAALY